MQAAMRPQIGIQRGQPRPVTAHMATASQGLLTRGSVQGAIMPGASVSGGYAPRGVASPVYKSAQPMCQTSGYQAASPATANYTTPMPRTAATAAAVQRPATLSGYVANGTAAPARGAYSLPKPAMAATPVGASSRVPAAMPTGFTAPTASAASFRAPAAMPTPGALPASTPQRVPNTAAKTVIGTPLVEKRRDLMNSENKYGSYARIAASEKVDKVGLPAQSPLPLRQRNVADPGNIVRSPMASPMAPLRPTVTEGLPVRTPPAPRQFSGPRELKPEPQKRSDFYAPPKEVLLEVQEPQPVVAQQSLEIPAPPQAAPCLVAETILPETVLPEVNVGLPPASDNFEFREPQGALSDPIIYMDEPPVQVEEQPIVMEPPVFQSYNVGPAGFSWQFIHAHPMVMEEEKVFICEALQELNSEIERFGGLLQYMFHNYSDCIKEGTPADELLQLAFLTCFQERSRNGQDSLNVLIGTGFSMGMKKVVKLEVQIQDPELQQLVLMAILWDWDVKLEWRGTHADD